MTRQTGLALVLVLWVLSLLTIMAGSFMLGMRREASIVAGARNNAQAAAIAESGIALAEMMLLSPEQNQRWRSDGSIYEISGTTAKVRVRLLSETGKIDINNADQALLQGLMTHAPADAELQTRLVDAILDWRDEDDLVHLEGAEKKEYRDAGLNYQPRNKPFQSIEELQLVLGMDEALYKWIEGLVTVYSGQPQVAVEQASREVLAVMPGVDAGMVDSYLAARVESAINNLPAPSFPSSPGQNNAAGQNTVLTLVSEALLDDESSAAVSAVVKPSGGEAGTPPFQVIKWRHAATHDASLFTDAMSELVVKQYAEPELDN